MSLYDYKLMHLSVDPRAWRPRPRGLGSGWVAGVGAILALALLASLPALVAAGQKRDYTYEEDPIRKGNKALEEGRLDDAQGNFNEAITYEYQVSKAKLGLAEVASAQGRPTEAIQFCREALVAQQKEKGDDRFPEAHGRLGLILIGVGEWEEGEKEIRLAHKQKQGLWTANYGMARLLLRAGEWEKAKEYLDKGKDRKGLWEGEDLYHYGMALYHQGKGDNKAAELEALNAFNMNALNPETGELLGKIYEDRNVPALAIDAYVNMLRNPQVTPTAQFMHRLGSLYQRDRRYNEARDSYLKAVEIDSTYLPPLRDLGDLLHLAEQYDRAAKVYLRYIQHEPDDVEVLARLSDSCNELGLSAQAFTYAEKAMQIDSTLVDVRLAYARAGIRSNDKSVKSNAAWVYGSLPDSLELESTDRILLATQQIDVARYDEARENLTKAIAADSTNADAYFQLGLLAMRPVPPNPDDAVREFERAIAIRPDAPLYYLNLGVAHMLGKRLEPSIEAFRKAIELDPRLAIGHVLLGETLVSSSSFDAAEEEFRTAIELDPKNPRALRGLGGCYLRKTHYPEAAETYESATQVDPGNANGWVGLAQAYLGLQDVPAAERALQKAEAIDPRNPTLLRTREVIQRAKGASGGQ